LTHAAKIIVQQLLEQQMENAKRKIQQKKKTKKNSHVCSTKGAASTSQDKF